MNIFNPPKFIKKLYFRENEQRFVILVTFVFKARSQKFSKKDIDRIIKISNNLNYSDFIKFINSHIKEKNI